MNLYGINPDTKLAAAIDDIANQSKVATIVESGTYHGDSTMVFAAIAKRVETIEIRGDNFNTAQEKLKHLANVRQHQGSSDLVLAANLERWDKAAAPGSLLIFLDAHWQDRWPLKQELQIINGVRKNGAALTVIVDDFEVPGRPNFGFCYDGGGEVGDPVRGPRLKLGTRIKCGYNDPFDKELDKFPHFYYPSYPEESIGYCIASDFTFDLGQYFRRIR